MHVHAHMYMVILGASSYFMYLCIYMYICIHRNRARMYESHAYSDTPYNYITVVEEANCVLVYWPDCI